jgi:glycosyltransferase involved in cell wall biosynthesis
LSRRLAVLTTYAVWPPRHGPQIRTAGLLGHLGDGWDVSSFSQSIQRTDLPWPRVHRCGEHWVEHPMRDPISAAVLIGLSKFGGFGPAYADRLLALSPRRSVRRALTKADVVLVSHHYQFSWVRAHTPANTPVVVDCHAIESRVWPARRAPWTRPVAREIERREREAYARADAVFATSEDDADKVRRLGGKDVTVVPNGVDVERFRPASRDERARLRHQLGLPADAIIGVFVGSAGYANRRALEVLERQSRAYEEAGILLVVVGRVGLQRQRVPGIIYAGEVTDVSDWVRAADIGLCPLLDGSGTSLKSVEYLAAGVAVLSSPIGIRGLGITNGDEAVFGDVDSLPSIAATLARDPGERDRLGRAARALAETRFSWQSIGSTAAAALDAIAARRHPPN